jgi:hypothetical protein
MRVMLSGPCIPVQRDERIGGWDVWADAMCLTIRSRELPSTAFLLPALVVNEQLGELLLQRLDLGTVADQDVGIGRIVECVVLVVVLCRIEALERLHLRDNAAGEDLLLGQLLNVLACQAPSGRSCPRPAPGGSAAWGRARRRRRCGAVGHR